MPHHMGRQPFARPRCHLGQGRVTVRPSRALAAVPIVAMRRRRALACVVRPPPHAACLLQR